MSEWRKVSLGEVVGLKRGFDLPGPSRRPGPYPVLGSSGISGWHDEGPVRGPGVTIGRSGASIGVATYFDGDYWPLNTVLFSENFMGNHPRYVYYLLDSIDFASFDSGSAQPSLNRNYIAGIRINLPGRKEQESITLLLGALDDKIAVNDQIAETAFDIADSRYLQLVSGANRVAKVSDLIELKYGKALPATARVDGEFPVYGSGGVTGTNDRPLVEGPGVIVGRKGTVGTVYWSEESFFPIDTTFYVDPRRSEVPMEFVFYMLRHLGLDGMNSDSAVPGLNRSNALALEIQVPGEAELQRFRNETRSLFALRESLARECARLADLRDALLPKLMSGEIHVRDAEKLVEDVT
jgi:type I restriction enzyme, S subunit